MVSLLGLTLTHYGRIALLLVTWIGEVIWSPLLRPWIPAQMLRPTLGAYLLESSGAVRHGFAKMV